MRYVTLEVEERRFVVLDMQERRTLKGRFHYHHQAETYAWDRNVKAILRLVQPEVFWADYPGRASAWRHHCSDYAGENERAIARSYAVVL